jgi:polyisoprenoid-binding protein YceI
VSRRSAGLRWLCGAGVAALVVGSIGRAPACELPAASPASAPGLVLRVAPPKSQVVFDAQAFLHSFSGRTSRIRGTLRLADGDRPDGAEACFRIDAASLETGNATRDAIMRDEHLQTSRFPVIAFDLLRVEGARSAADGWEFVARGTLTLRGATREIRFPVLARRVGDDLRLTGEVPVRMSDHGIPAPKFLFLTVEDRVLVRFDILAARAP